MTAPPEPHDFSWQMTASGLLRIQHQGRLAATLQGAPALALLARLERAGEAGRQHLLARATGQYRRGNEGDATRHPRHRPS